jgi:hypothetical protein
LSLISPDQDPSRKLFSDFALDWLKPAIDLRKHAEMVSLKELLHQIMPAADCVGNR